MDIAIHVDASQPHQIEHGQWLSAGFRRHGLKPHVTYNPESGADIHVVSGPHFAWRQCLGHPTLWLDRCYYRAGERPKGMISMPDVSLGWLTEGGGRTFRKGEGREPPEVTQEAAETGVIFLADYQGPIETADTVRYHPAQQVASEPLRDALRRHRTAVGYGTTSLVTAALMGLDVVCRDDRHIMARPDWLELLPYADWHHSEIASGEAWEHLKYEL